MPNLPTFVGIDPSMRGTSIVETDASGNILQVRRIRFPKLKSLSLLDSLDADFRKLIADMKSKNPQPFLAIEDVSLNSFYLRYEQFFIQGVFRLSLKRSSLPFVIISPAKVKSFLSLKLRSQGKQAVRESVRNLYPTLDVYDTLKDDNDIDAFVISRMAAISYAYLIGEENKIPVPELSTLDERRIQLFFAPKRKLKGSLVYPGILQRADYLMNWNGEKRFGWSELN